LTIEDICSIIVLSVVAHRASDVAAPPIKGERMILYAPSQPSLVPEPGFNGTGLALNGIQLVFNGTQLASNGIELALNRLQWAATGLQRDQIGRHKSLILLAAASGGREMPRLFSFRRQEIRRGPPAEAVPESLHLTGVAPARPPE